MFCCWYSGRRKNLDDKARTLWMLTLIRAKKVIKKNLSHSPLSISALVQTRVGPGGQLPTAGYCRRMSVMPQDDVIIIPPAWAMPRGHELCDAILSSRGTAFPSATKNADTRVRNIAHRLDARQLPSKTTLQDSSISLIQSPAVVLSRSQPNVWH
jgi:hypothetical protein